MAHTQMTDRNPFDSGLMDELTDGELLAINGGGFSEKGGFDDLGASVRSQGDLDALSKRIPRPSIFPRPPIFPR
jgi:hypothetical protein